MSLLIALFAIAALIWMVPVVQRGRLLVIATGVLIVGTLFGPYFYAIDGPIQLSLDRILWASLFGLAVIGWRFGQVRIPSPTRMDWVVGGIVVWFLLSALRGGPDPPKITPEARWLFYVAMPAGMYLIARIIRPHLQDIHWLFAALVGLGLYLSITALFEVFGLHGLVFPRYIVDGESWQFFGRGRGPLMNPTGNGLIISIALTAASIGFIEADRKGKLLYGVALLILFSGLYATLTRSAWLGGVASLAIIGFVYAPRWLRVLGMAALVLMIGAAAIGVKDQVVRMKRDKNLTAADAEKSVKLRPLLAVVAWEMFKDRPLSGHGFGRYGQTKARFHTNRGYGLPLEQARDYVQHNVFLSVLVDTGMIGLGLMLSWMVMIAGVAWTLARNLLSTRESRAIGLLILGTLAAYGCNGMFHDIMIIPMVHMFLFFLAGVAVTAYQSGLASERRQLPWRAFQTRPLQSS